MISRTITEIRNIFDEIRTEIPCENELDGKIYYMNGNDGTDFDWHMNDMLCEFMMFHTNEMGYIKMSIKSDDSVKVYIYPEGEMIPSAERKYVFPDGSAKELAIAMYELCDAENIWDVDIDMLDFNSARGIYEYKFDDEEEDW